MAMCGGRLRRLLSRQRHSRPVRDGELADMLESDCSPADSLTSDDEHFDTAGSHTVRRYAAHSKYYEHWAH